MRYIAMAKLIGVFVVFGAGRRRLVRYLQVAEW
jgi:hypothetical protein